MRRIEERAPTWRAREAAVRPDGPLGRVSVTAWTWGGIGSLHVRCMHAHVGEWLNETSPRPAESIGFGASSMNLWPLVTIPHLFQQNSC